MSFSLWTGAFLIKFDDPVGKKGEAYFPNLIVKTH
jgi:hypothetical protein